MKKLLIFMFGFLLLCSCASTTKIVEVPVEVVKDHYVYNCDTVIQKDSIYYGVFTKGDTVYKDKLIYKYINHVTHDSVCIVDSIPYPVPVEVKVYENRLYWWQETLMYIGMLTVFVIVIRAILVKFKFI